MALRQRNISFTNLRTHLTGDLAFSAAWAAQSRLASIALFAFIAFSSVWMTMAMMMAWSLAATIVYFVARKYGAPDLLETQLPSPGRETLQTSVRTAVSSVLRICLVGPAAFVYTRLLSLKAPGECPRRRACHAIVLTTGATLFGVTTTHYILRKGGYEGAGLLRLSCLGSALNVAYRTLLSTLLFAGLTHLLTITGVAHLL